MSKQQWSLPTAMGRSIVVEVAGDVKLAGWDEAVVLVQAAEGSRVDLLDTETGVSLQVDGDCSVQLPRDAHVTLTVRGDARVGGLLGPLVVTEVAGDLALRQVGPAELGSVAGDLAVKGVAGDLTVGLVAGDVSVLGVAGDLSIASAAADLAVRDVAGSLSANCGADASLALDPRPGMAYDVTAGADILCRLPAGASAELTLVSGNDGVQVRVPGATVDEGEAGVRRIVLGDGAARIALQAGADIVLATDGAVGPGDFAAVNMDALEVDMARIAREMEASMAGLAEQIAASLHSAGFSTDEAERVAQRVSHANERAMKHAQHGVQRAQRHAERARRRAERHAEHGQGRGWSWRWGGHFGGGPASGAGTRPQAGRSARPAASDEERAAVLRMLSERKISTEEASRLLEALEGR
jgi:hypothetical protein